MYIEIASVIVVAAALAYRFGPEYISKSRAKNSADWPETEATIQSGEMEMIERVGHLREKVPFLSFSYIVGGDYYSGRFGLRVTEDRAITLIREWGNHKITVRYDPKRPEVYALPEEMPVEGFRVDVVREYDLASNH